MSFNSLLGLIENFRINKISLDHYPILSCPVLSCPVLSCPVPSRPVPSHPILSHPIPSYPILIYHNLFTYCHFFQVLQNVLQNLETVKESWGDAETNLANAKISQEQVLSKSAFKAATSATVGSVTSVGG